MIQSGKIVFVAGLVGILTACIGGGISEDEACDLAVEWLDKKGFPTKQDGKVRDWELQGCSNFRSKSDEDAATIDVASTRLVTIIDQGDREIEEKNLKSVAMCTLFDYDQGWTVEACIPAP